MDEELCAGGVLFRPSGSGDEVLVGEQNDRNSGARTLRLPKGHVEPGETLEEGALREVAEETGHAATILERLEDVHYAYTERSTDTQVRKRVVFFLMEPTGDIGGKRDTEMEHVFWLPVHRALAELTFETERGVLRDALGRRPASGTL